MLEPYFVAAQDEFAKHERRVLRAGYVSQVELHCAPWRELRRSHGFTHRNFAATSEDGGMIVVAPELAELPPETVAAIIAHEFGHVLDFAHPSRYVVVRGELMLYDVPDVSDKEGAQARSARMRQWIERDTDLVEGTADEIAGVVLGREIRYAGPCMIQTFEMAGTKRPTGLV